MAQEGENRMSRYFMGIDVGTTGGRACIFDDSGNMVGQSYQEYLCHYPNPTWVEQYVGEMLPILYGVSKDAIASSGVKAEQIESVAFSMQGPVTCLLDENYELLTPLIGWQDLRGLPYFGEAIQKLENPLEYYQVTGGPLAPSNPIAKMVWLKNEMPDVWAKAKYISGGMEYFCKKFGSDEFVTDTTVAARTMLLDIDRKCFSEEMMNRLEIDITKYPKVVTSGTVVGTIKGDIVELTGLTEGTKLVMGAHDQNASTLGMGMIFPGQAGFTLGTAGLVTTITEESKRDEKALFIASPNASVGNYTIEGISFASASAYKWYRDIFCNAEVEAGRNLLLDPYDIINQQARKSKPGANGVTFLNFLQGAAGVLNDYNARAMFSGMTFSTTKGDITRAVMEGIVYEARSMTEAMADMGISVDEIRLSGGGSKSRTWCQMQADIFGVPIVLLQCSELSALGAAMLAGVGTGAFTDIKDAVEKCVHIKKKYVPNTETKEAYDKAYEKYKGCFEAMQKENAW